MSEERAVHSLAATAALFLRLGATSFGGPAAHIALMQNEFVRKRQWLSREAFLDYLGAANLIPGPNSTELAMHIGFARHGWVGLFVAGVCFIVPSALIVGALAWGYVRYGALPQVEGLFRGVTPVVVAIVLGALWTLGQTAVKSGKDVVLGLAAIAALLAGVHEVVVLLLAGVAGAASAMSSRLQVLLALVGTSGFPGGIIASAASSAAAPYSLWGLFIIVTRIGALLFGSGYVLLAFLRADFVERLGWLTEQQLLDAVAVGQATPGPLFTTATFVGYLVGGATGAVIATIGIFLPAFVFVALSGPLVPRLRRSRVAAAVLDAVNVASLAMMAVVVAQLGYAALRSPAAVVAALVSLVLLRRDTINPAWLLAAGALAGWLFDR